MSQSADYVVEQTDKESLRAKVCKYLAMGYEPVGSMTCGTDDHGFFGPLEPETHYRQAMYRRFIP